MNSAIVEWEKNILWAGMNSDKIKELIKKCPQMRHSVNLPGFFNSSFELRCDLNTCSEIIAFSRNQRIIEEKAKQKVCWWQ